MAQSVERLTRNEKVAGSIPAGSLHQKSPQNLVNRGSRGFLPCEKCLSVLGENRVFFGSQKVFSHQSHWQNAVQFHWSARKYIYRCGQGL